MDNKLVRVLLIEDDVDYAQLLKTMLNKTKDINFDLVWTDCLLEGLKRLAADGINVIILDLQLPNSGGLNTFVRTHAKVSHIPIIILTGSGDEKHALSALKMGAQDYLIKGEVNSKHLIRVIRCAIERHSLYQARLNAVNLDSNDSYIHNIIKNNADGIIVIDKNGIVLYINNAAEKIFSRNADELLGKPFGFPIVTGEKTEIDIVNRIGVTTVVEMRVVETNWQGETTYIASLRDITEHKILEEALRDLSVRDDLTGLYNHRGFEALALKHFNLAKRKKANLQSSILI